MHTWLEISRSALRNNVSVFRQLNASTELALVLKSNAYGHGLLETYQAIADLNPEWLCVAYEAEARLLRDEGFKGRIMMVTPVYENEFAAMADLNAEILITHQELLDAWLASEAKPKIHLKFDTGLTRQGFYPDKIAALIDALILHKPQVAGLCTHFANVEDVLESDFADLQVTRFNQAVTAFRDAGFKFIAHCASSASDLIMESARFDLCRVGISLYGFWPSSTTRLSYLQVNKNVAELQPALTWKTKIAMLKDVPEGSFIGYGCTFKAVKNMKIAVLPVGYNEGFPRVAAEDQSYLLVRGHRCALVGRISMNMMVIDVSHVSGVARYDDVVLVGSSGDETLEAATVAGWARTIHYELVTRINPALERRMVD